MNKILIALVSFVFLIGLSGNVLGDPSVGWIRSFGTSSDTGRAVAVDSLDNVLATGESSGDMYTIKHDSNGKLLWTKSYSGVSGDRLRGIAVDSLDNVIVTGRSNGAYYTVKYDSNGNHLWNRTGVSGRAWAVAVDSLDNVIVTGESSGRDIITIKYDSNGNLLWTQIYSGLGDDFAYGVAVDSADNVIVSGESDLDATGADDYVIIKYDSSGNLLWTRTSDGRGEEAWGVAVDSVDNIIVTGYTQQGIDYLTIKYDSNGNKLWERTYEGGANDFGFHVAVDSADNIIVTGESYLAGNTDYYTIKYDSNGNILWTARYDGGNSDIAWGVAVDSQDDVIVTGQSYNGVNFDFTTVKYIDSPPSLLDLSNLITDKPRYSQGEIVTTTATVNNNLGSTASDVFVDFVYKDPNGATINTDTQKIKRLRAGQSKDAVSSYTLGSLLGIYTVEASVRWNSEIYDTEQTTFQVAVTSLPDVSMYVEAIDFSTSQGGKTEKMFITVTVLDENLNPVSGATVSGELTLPDSSMKTYSGDTGADGKVTFEHSVRNQPLPTGTFTFTVTDVVKSGVAYDPAQNKETSDSFTIGGGPTNVVMHVDAIDFTTQQTKKSEKLLITVTIFDEDLNPVSGATVSGELKLPDSTLKTYSGGTGADGKVTFEYSVKNQQLPSGTYTFTVTDVAKSGSTYNPAQNVETLDSFVK
jgi:uncharacterized delta-60 repeat protein